MAQGGNIHVVKLRRLRNELRRAREAAGLTQKQVSEDLGWSISKIIRLETGAANIMTADVMALLHEYKITDLERANGLLAITRDKDQAWWWDEYKDAFQDFPQFLNYLAFEDSASGIRQFHGLTMPGLLQTEQYVRTLIGITDDPQVIEANVQVRLRRQELLRRPNPPDVTSILDESVIRRVIGDHGVMVEQLHHIRELNAYPNINIQIVPFSAGIVGGMNRSFTILDLSEKDGTGDVDYVVDVEDIHHDTLVRDIPEVTSDYAEAFYEIRELALPATETNQLIESVIDEMSRLV